MGLLTLEPLRHGGAAAAEPLPARGYSADEVRRLLAVVPDTVPGRRDRAILLIFILTGRRRAEVMDLKAGDIEVEDGTVFYSLPWQGRQAGTARAATTGLGGHPADAGRLRQGAGGDGARRVALAGGRRAEGSVGLDVLRDGSGGTCRQQG